MWKLLPVTSPTLTVFILSVCLCVVCGTFLVEIVDKLYYTLRRHTIGAPRQRCTLAYGSVRYMTQPDPLPDVLD